MRGIDLFLETLADFGIRHLFGNPGTSELPLNDAIRDHPRLTYILGLHEIPVMGMADGFAMASGQLGVVNLHVSCGVGNAMGLLYNAFREGSPLLVTAGQQDRRLLIEEPILYGDLVRVVQPWTKFAFEVHRVAELPTVMRRAIQAALTPPTGPVFISLPMDLQMEEVRGIQPAEIRLPRTQVHPPRKAVMEAAELLAAAQHPAILAGSRVTSRGAVEPLVRIAETLGAPVFSEPLSHHGRLAFPCDHPLYAQSLPMWSPEIRSRLDRFDVLLVTGMDLFRLYIYHEPAQAIPETVRIIHLDEDPRELGKNYPLAVGLWGDTRTGLEDLAEELDRQLTASQRSFAAARRDDQTRQSQQQRESLAAALGSQTPTSPPSATQLMHAIARALPDDVAVIEAAVTTTGSLLERLGALRNTSGYFGQRGWTLGWGLNAALGVKLAWPNRPVLGILGDGAAMYGIQGLWSAAHHQIPVTFVICNNGQYQILKEGAVGLKLPHAERNEFTALDLSEPAIDFVALAGSLGVAAMRLTHPDQITDALREAWQRDRPLLIDVPLAREVP